MGRKRVDDLKIDSDRYEDKYKKATNKAVKRLLELGKRKPHIYGGGRIRIHHRGKYFDYSAISGKWSDVEYSNEPWNKSSSVDDFIRRIDLRMDRYHAYVNGYKKFK